MPKVFRLQLNWRWFVVVAAVSMLIGLGLMTNGVSIAGASAVTFGVGLFFGFLGSHLRSARKRLKPLPGDATWEEIEVLCKKLYLSFSQRLGGGYMINGRGFTLPSGARAYVNTILEERS